MSKRVGIIGSGCMATEYLKASTAVSTLKFEAIWSRNSLTATELSNQYEVRDVVSRVEDLKELNLDFIIICVPELATEDIVMKCLDFGIPLLVEKPVGLTVESGLRIQKSASDLEVPIFAALNRRFYGSTLAFMDQLAEVSGKRFVKIVDQENTIAAHEAGQPPEVIKNWMFANSIHIIDFITLVCRGDLKEISNSTFQLSKESFVHQSELFFSTGDQASYTGYWNAPSGWSVDVTTSLKTWKLSPLENLQSRQINDRSYSKEVQDQDDIEFKPGILKILKAVGDFNSAYKTSLPTIESSNKTMKLIDMIYKNA
jgi:predicted dehydrogenase